MTTTHWPGSGIRRSTGNGFDLAARRAQGPSVFATPSEAVKAAQHIQGAQAGKTSRAKRPGPAPDRGHVVMPNLSARATRELKKGAASISLGNQADTERRQRARKSSI